MNPVSSRLLDRKSVIRAGFAVVLALGLFSVIEASRIQFDLSSASEGIYQRHLEQDEVRFELRRTLWRASSAARDYLLNPAADRDDAYRRQLAPLRRDSDQLLKKLEQLPQSAQLKRGVDEYWTAIAGLPKFTEPLDRQGRYEFVQREVTVRRNELGDMLRRWDTLSQDSLSESRRRFAESRRFAERRLFWILGLSLLIAAAVALLSLRYSERLERQASLQHQQVAETKDELARLSSRLMEVQEQERAHLARELHDEIGQGLATLRLEVARAEALPEQRLREIRERMGRARLLADSIVQTVRNICMLLRPSMLDDLGLIPAIQWLAQDFQARTGVHCRFAADDVSDELPEPLRTCVYRVVQESLHNCEKHADARTAAVTLQQAGEWLLTIIEDDGRGFQTPAAHPAKGFGLMGMRERALSAGGTLKIDSAPGRGTRVELALPVPPRTETLQPAVAAEV